MEPKKIIAAKDSAFFGTEEVKFLLLADFGLVI
jgi:hypothetical protein